MTEQEALIVLVNHECTSSDWDEAVLIAVASLRELEKLREAAEHVIYRFGKVFPEHDDLFEAELGLAALRELVE